MILKVNWEKKESTIKVNLDTFLHVFGSIDEKKFLQQAEDYLAKVVSPTARCTTFDELRLENQTGKKASLINLPPTSNSIKGHLYCCFFIIQEQAIIYSKIESHADPGWVVDSDVMLQTRCCCQC